MYAINIKWDTDGEAINLPQKVKIPASVIKEQKTVDTAVADWLSDRYGWCIFSLDIVKK